MPNEIEENTPAPDFTLDDFFGRRFQLSEQLKNQNVVLILNRGFR